MRREVLSVTRTSPRMAFLALVVAAGRGQLDAQAAQTPGAELLEPPRFSVTNLALDGRIFESDQPLARYGTLWLVVEESAQGTTDLNGDGDATDQILHAYDLRTGHLDNVAIDSGFSGSATDELILVAVGEGNEGVDLNGDGDTGDQVVHKHELASGTTTNLGVSGGVRRRVDNTVLLLVNESSEGMDLNGDGFLDDSVPQLHFLEQGITFNVGVHTGFHALEGSLLAFETSEAGNGGTDLNGDGDTGDIVLSVHDLSTGISSFLGAIKFEFFQEWILSPEVVLYELHEPTQGQDLNGDGDMLDNVGHIHRPSSGVTVNIGLDIRSPILHGDFIVFLAREDDQDLNGDGDTADEVLHVFDAVEDTVTNIGVQATFLPAPRERAAQNGTLAFTVSESGNGNVDLNGDPDLEDRVVHSLRLARPPVLTNHGLAGSVQGVGNGLIAVNVDEQDHFNASLNGDFDTLDHVPHVIDVLTGDVTNLGSAGSILAIAERWFVWTVAEGDDGNVDRNGDGDTEDDVVLVQQFGQPPVDTGLAYWRGRLVGLDTYAFQVLERDQGDTDLNGDGDAIDSVLHVIHRTVPRRP